MRLKEEELKNNEAQQKQAEEQRAKEAAAALEKQAMESFGIQALAHIVRESKDKQNHLTQVETSLKNFIDNAQVCGFCLPGCDFYFVHLSAIVF